MPDKETGTEQKLMRMNQDLELKYWLRWRKERRNDEVSKKRARNGLTIPPNTTSMEPPQMIPKIGRKDRKKEPEKVREMME